MNRQYAFVLVAAAVLVASGCGEKVPSLGQVSGIVKLEDGTVLENVSVTFAPDAERGSVGRQAKATTDANGKYTLTYQFPDKVQPGCATGWNKIAVKDLNIYGALRSRDEDRDRDGEQGSNDPRISSMYSSTATTPLELDVQEGEQTHDIVLKPRDDDGGGGEGRFGRERS